LMSGEALHGGKKKIYFSLHPPVLTPTSCCRRQQLP